MLHSCKALQKHGIFAFVRGPWDQFWRNSRGDKTGENELRGTLVDLGGKQCLSEELRLSATLGGTFFLVGLKQFTSPIMSNSNKIQLVLDPSYNN